MASNTVHNEYVQLPTTVKSFMGLLIEQPSQYTQFKASFFSPLWGGCGEGRFLWPSIKRCFSTYSPTLVGNKEFNNIIIINNFFVIYVGQLKIIKIFFSSSFNNKKWSYQCAWGDFFSFSSWGGHTWLARIFPKMK